MRSVILAIGALLWFGLFQSTSVVYAAERPAVKLTITDPKMPASPGYHTLHANVTADGKDIKFACGIFLPRAYFQPNELMPIVMTLHNRGDSGFDGEGVTGEGLALLISRNDPDTRGEGEMPAHPIKLHDDAQFICLAPQCPAGYEWHSASVPAILDEFITQITKLYRADPDRVYLTGFSYGASSTWQVAVEIPHRFAAIIPVDGRAAANPAQAAAMLKEVATYICVGGNDGEFVGEAQRMRDAFLAAKHATLVYRVIPRGNHWGYSCLYDDPQFWKWVFAQRRTGSRASTTGPAMHPASRRTPLMVSAAATRPAANGRKAVLCRYFRDISGILLDDLTGNVAYPQFPDEQIFLDRFELPVYEADSFATVLQATITPPKTGDYTFYIAGQDQCELYLSGDDKPEGLKQIAGVLLWSLPRDWVADPHQQSNPIHLTAGKPYFIEARNKHGEGDNHVSVAWRLPDGTVEGPIPGDRLRAPAMEHVPAARVLSIEPAVGFATGVYRINMSVNYKSRTDTVWLVLTIPRKNISAGALPLVVYCPGGNPVNKGNLRLDGPAAMFSPNSLVQGPPMMVLTLPCSIGKSWNNLWLQHATAAAVQAVLDQPFVDRDRVYLTGAASGTSGVWAMASLLPGRFAAVVPFAPLLSEDPKLVAALDGTRVQLVTGVIDGMATDRANRMNDALAAIRPQPDVQYEMEMGTEVASVYYARSDFYDWLRGWRRKPGQAVEPVDGRKPGSSYDITATVVGILTVMASVLGLVIAALFVWKSAYPTSRGRQPRISNAMSAT